MMIMQNANVLAMNGGVQRSIELSDVFDEEVREDLIRRAVVAENTLRLQPKGHYPLAGMQTTARYYGAMSSYRTGRHMGVPARPRQKLASGRQGDVRRIPSAVKGKRAHPHVIEKTLVENINRKEYQKAIRSSIAATSKEDYVKRKHAIGALKLPIVLSNEIESVKRTRDVVAALASLKLTDDMERSRRRTRRKGQRRLASQSHHRRTVLIVVNKDEGVVKAARNIPGVDACTVRGLRAALLAPGGVPGRVTVWSEDAVKNLKSEVLNLSL